MTLTLRILVWAPVALVVAVGMEFWAALLHRHVWHGRLWSVHRTHHGRRARRFELNDVLSALHAPLAVALILVGCRAEPGWPRELAFGVGLGMTIFGVSYALVHDGLVHRRLPVGVLSRIGYLREVARAHRAHHSRESHGPPYGLFLGPRELRHRSLTTSRPKPIVPG